MTIFVDIEHSFIRQPIKLALANQLNDKITFVTNEDEADLVVGPSDKTYSKPCIILSDDPNTLIVNNTCLAINPTPTNKSEMYTLVLKVKDIVHSLSVLRGI